MATMNKETTRTYAIEVNKTVKQVLDLLTRKREYALLFTHAELSCSQKMSLTRGDHIWLEICSAGGTGNPHQPERLYLAIGGELDSRDDMRIDDMQEASSLVSEMKDCSVALPPMRDLCDLCRERTLRFQIDASSEEEANRIWLREMLRLGEDPGKWYASDDFSSITVSLRHVAEGAESEAAGSAADCGNPEAVDVAEFEVYDRLYGKLEHTARNWAYGDDVFVEYSISSDERSARYCATEFYSNHNWDADPANLLVVRFDAEVSPERCSARDVQFSHPTKTTERKSDHERFLVDSLTMVNDIETKFSCGIGEDKHPDESVSANHIMDNLIDFVMWVEMHRKEIELL